jgi:hypothetical protein
MSHSEDTILADDPRIERVEQRADERLKVYLNVMWEGVLGRDKGTISDISQGGCFILSGAKVIPQELIRVEIQFPTDEWVTTWGEVANYTEEIGFGIRYTEFDEGREKYDDLIRCVQQIQSATAALRQLDAATVRREYDTPLELLVTAQDYKTLVMMTFAKVNRALLSLPECSKKANLRSALEAYMDASRAWDAALKDGVEGHKLRIKMHKRLQEKYNAPRETLSALVRRDPYPVLNFLWNEGAFYLARG